MTQVDVLEICRAAARTHASKAPRDVDVDDLTQEACLRVLKCINDRPEHGDNPFYLARVASMQVLYVVRKALREQTYSRRRVEQAHESDFEVLPTPFSNATDMLSALEEKLEERLTEERSRRLVNLVVFGGYSLQHVSEMERTSYKQTWNLWTYKVRPVVYDVVAEIAQ